jgi:predicted small secreted protein
MKQNLALVLMLAATVAACQNTPDFTHPGGGPDTAQDAAATASGSAAESTAPAAAAAPTQRVRHEAPRQKNADDIVVRRPQPTVPELAYAYGYQVKAPSRDVPSLVRQHESACVLAGATVCQVVGAATQSIGTDEVSGRLEVRATPMWINAFRDRIEGDVQAMGGKIETAGTQTEDLSRSLTDTEANIRAKTALRDRLENLLRNHSGKLQDLVETERQLAEVQGEIDASRSELAVMGARVQMANLTVEYRSLAGLAPNSAFRPVKEAGGSFVRNMMGGVAAILTFASFALPFAGAGWIVWLVLRRRRRVIPTAPAA